jgi:uncharacterized coiled-coil protein SlyX
MHLAHRSNDPLQIYRTVIIAGLLRRATMSNHESDSPPARRGDALPLSTRQSTQPPGPGEALAKAVMETMLPAEHSDTAASPPRVSYFEETARDFAASLVEMRATRKAIADGFRAQEKSAKATRREVAKATRAAKAASVNIELVRHEFSGMKETFGAFRREVDDRFRALEDKVASLEKHVAEQDDAIERGREHVAKNKAQVEQLRKELEIARGRGSETAPPAG